MALVVFGASGDLAARKLFPAMAALADTRRPADNGFTVIGVARTEWTRRGVPPDTCSGAVPRRTGRQWKEFVRTVPLHRGEYGDPDTFDALKSVLDEADQDRAARPATGSTTWPPFPTSSARWPRALAKHGCNAPAGDGTFARLVVEKPFGRDLASALEL